MKISDWLKEIPEIKNKKPRLEEVNYFWILGIISGVKSSPKPKEVLEWIKNYEIDTRRF